MTMVPAGCWLHPDVEVRRSRIAGLGLFAGKAIPVGTVVSRLGGRLVSWEELQEIFAVAAAAAEPYYVDTIALADDAHLVLPPDTPNGKGNHSCDPNLVWDGAFAVSTCRAIEPGEELTIDYAPMSHGAVSAVPCVCGSSRCRGLVPG